MSTPALFADFSQLHLRWGWFVALGILLLVLGIIALAYVPAATLATVLALGWLMFSAALWKPCTHSTHAAGVACFCTLRAAHTGILVGLLVVRIRSLDLSRGRCCLPHS